MHQVDLLMLNKRLSLAPIDKGCQAEKSNVTDTEKQDKDSSRGYNRYEELTVAGSNKAISLKSTFSI